ncbi:MAG: hypothetical protein AB1505_22025, partial [Candidatus Latescibacterota bacterium]
MIPRGRRAAWLVLGLVVALFLLAVLTPAPVWVGLRAASYLAPRTGWDVEVGHYAGSAAGGLVLEGVVATSRDTSVVVLVERVAVQPLGYSLTLERPQVRVRLVSALATEPPAAAPLSRLPVERIPALTVHRGALVVLQPDGAVKLVADSLEATYQALGDTTGELLVQTVRLLVPRRAAEELRGEALLAARLTPSTVTLDSVSLAAVLDTLALRVGGAGKLVLQDGLPAAARLAAQVQARGGELGGRADLDLQGEMRPMDLRGRVRLEGRHPALERVALQAQAAVDAQGVHLDSLAGEVLGGRLQGRVAYYPPQDSLDVLAAVDSMRWGRLAPGVSAGPASLRLSATGVVAAGRYNVALRVDQSDLEVMPGRSFDVQLAAIHRPDRSTQVHLLSPALELIARGRADLDSLPGPRSYDLSLSGTLRPDLLLPDMTGPAAPVRITGRARPDSVQLELFADHPPVAGLQDFGRLAARLELTGNRLLAARMSVEEEMLQVSLRLDLGAGRLEAMQARLRGLGLPRLNSKLRGRMSGQVDGHGLLSAAGLEAQGLLTVEDPGFAEWGAGPLAVRLAYRGGVGQAWLEGSHLQAEARLDAAGKLRGAATFAGPVLYRTSPPAPAADTLAPASPAPGDTAGSAQSVPAVALSMGGNLTWELDLERPAEATALLDLDTLWAEHEGWWARSLAPLHLRYADGGLDLGEAALRTPVGDLRLGGTARPDSLALSARLDSLDLASLVPGIELRGSARLDVLGTMQRPRAQGVVDVRNARLDTLVLGDLTARLDLQDTLQLALALHQYSHEAARAHLQVPAAALLRGRAGPEAISGGQRRSAASPG